MIANLTFDPSTESHEGALVRRCRLIEEAAVPLQVACQVANGTRDVFCGLLARHVPAELSEPVLLDVASRAALFAQGRALRVHGSACDAFVVLRERDAHRLIAAAFDESHRSASSALSAAELSVVERFAQAAGSACAPLCGTVRGTAPIASVDAAAASVAYLEVRLLEPIGVAIGFGVGRRAPEASGSIRAMALGSVAWDARVSVGRSLVPLSFIANIRSGSVVTLDSRVDDAAVLGIDGQTIAHGVCGVDGDRLAFQVSNLPWRTHG